jgi:hypothetical protein
VASFKSVWEAESGTNGTDAADAVDATASGGNRVTISFATSTAMVERFRISVSQVLGSNHNHMIGNYLVLARMRASAAVIPANRFLVRLYQGLLGGETELTGETAFAQNIWYPDSTKWTLAEVGAFKIPPQGYRFGESGWVSNSTLYFYVQRLAGSASLYVDCLILIPTDPILTIKSGGMSGSVNDVAIWESTPIGDAASTVYDAGTTSYSTREHSTGAPMVLPRDGGILVLATQQTGESKTTPTHNLDMYYHPRYPLFRET